MRPFRMSFPFWRKRILSPKWRMSSRSWLPMMTVVPPAVDLLEKGDDLERQLRVEVAGGLVGQEDLRVVDDGPGDGHPLLFAVGQPRREVPHLGVEVDQAERVEDPPPDLLARLAQDLQGQGHVVENGPVEEEAEILEDDAHRPPELVDPVVRQSSGR